MKFLRPLCGLLLVIVAARRGFAQPPLPLTALRQSIPVGEKPRGLALADFNGDGKIDIVTGNQNSNTITVLLSEAGHFKATTASPIKVGSAPRTPVCADFNGDGKIDIVVPNSEGGNLTVLIGDGNGGFSLSPASPVRTNGKPVAMAMADFDGNGKPDLAIANNAGSSVSIFLGSGDGTFSREGTPITVGQTPFHVETTDFNGDKIPDLAVANYGGNSVSVLLGKGGGAFGAKMDVRTGPSPRALACADFDGDGKTDMVVTNLGANSISLFRGDGQGGFGQKTDFVVGRQPRCAAVADYNRDGRLDVAIANESSDSVSILLNNGNGGFADAVRGSVEVGSQPSFVATADLNGDGMPDLAVSNGASNDISIFRGNGSGGFRPYR
jgi:hypothetical protein